MMLNKFRYILKYVIVWRRNRNLRVSKKEKMKVIFDSNFLFVPSQFQLDIFEGMANLLNQRFECILLAPIRRELEKLAREGSPKTRQEASLALNLADKCRVVPVKKGLRETNDDVIVRVASELQCLVATNDRKLRKRLRSLGIPVVSRHRRDPGQPHPGSIGAAREKRGRNPPGRPRPCPRAPG